jgi:hypothetical protein
MPRGTMICAPPHSERRGLYQDRPADAGDDLSLYDLTMLLAALNAMHRKVWSIMHEVSRLR